MVARYSVRGTRMRYTEPTIGWMDARGDASPVRMKTLLETRRTRHVTLSPESWSRVPETDCRRRREAAAAAARGDATNASFYARRSGLFLDYL